MAKSTAAFVSLWLLIKSKHVLDLLVFKVVFRCTYCFLWNVRLAMYRAISTMLNTSAS